ncbi:hypothetical protein GALMADRAFT_212802 [Galerina marginata CBS 339.88]|uniref:C3H1-type domain-containing protein n=1 Tax=Galerina marginata (strain CBS 339.88) TaxID=685588 RepID=A0A067T165_GALM3|nr:hypothetical protein GALMADRAFT_212802 [Galerina marginata CBS 339.88]
MPPLMANLMPTTEIFPTSAGNSPSQTYHGTRMTSSLKTLHTCPVKSSIRNSAHAPSGFPTSQWERIIRGEPVNLNVVFSYLHRTEPPKENVGRVGDTQVVFGISEAKKRVETAELREYGEYIEGEFSAKIPSVHSRIILFDIAVRNEVQGGQRLRLTDTYKFQRLYSAIVMSDGVEGSKCAGGQANRSGTGSKLKICNHHNSPSGCTVTDCKFEHICRVCLKPGHSKDQHGEKGRQ